MRERYVWDKAARDWVPFAQYRRPATGTATYVISDNLDGVWNPVDGKQYDSKSSYYRAVRQAGCEIIGNERVEPKPKEHRPSGIGHDLKRAFETHGH